MKKFMKALAFATVMCMLLSTAAFATNPAATLDQATDYKFDVVVTTASNEAEQVSLLVVKSDAALATLQNTDILFVGQTASSAGTATFEDVLVDSAKVADGKVDIYAGYASANGPAVCCDDFSVVNAKELAITLAGMEVIADVAAWVEANGTDAQKAITAPDREVATMVRATVNFANLGDNEIDRVGWIFNTNAGKRYAEVIVADAGWNLIDGDVKIGVSFANGWKADFAEAEGYKAPLTFDEGDVELYLRVNGVKTQVK